MPTPLPRQLHHASYDAAALERTKSGTTITVCLPARDEAETIGDIVADLHRHLVVGVPLIDELVVLDDGSSDQTARVAAAAGARVVAASDVLRDHPAGPGKGQALWRSLHATTGDVVAWCDADIRDFDVRFVVGLVGPLLEDPDLVFVKGCYDRPTEEAETGGGRVTELVARPAIALLHPLLAGFVQPLSGEFAGRRAALERVPFVDGYGVDLGLLIDLVAEFGLERVAQVDLGTRRHRNRPLAELAPQALAVLHVALQRAGVDHLPESASLPIAQADPVVVACSERPPLASLVPATPS